LSESISGFDLLNRSRSMIAFARLPGAPTGCLEPLPDCLSRRHQHSLPDGFEIRRFWLDLMAQRNDDAGAIAIRKFSKKPPALE
jgi:hypothetical protein